VAGFLQRTDAVWSRIRHLAELGVQQSNAELASLAEGLRHQVLTAVSRSDERAGLYGAQGTQASYAGLYALAVPVLRGGCDAVLDATFLQRAERDRARAVAVRLGVSLVILDFPVSRRRLRARVAARAARVGEVSEALKALAVQTGAAFLTLAQLNRESEREKGRLPRLSDLADSGHTLNAVVHQLRTNYKPISELRTAVIWTKGLSTFQPDYSVDFLPTNPWIHQPFESYDALGPDKLLEKWKI
jgi:predicted kinase